MPSAAPSNAASSLIEVELHDLLDALAAKLGRNADVGVVDAVLAGRPRADGQHRVESFTIASTIAVTDALGA